MKRIVLFSLLALAAGAAFAQTSVRPPVDVTGVQTGVPCDAALGRAMATTATGAMICTDRVSRSSTADTATTADTAQNALNAVNANNLTGTLDAAQITGQLSNSALPNCPDPAKPIPTASGCVAAGSSGGGAQVVCVSKGMNVSGSMYASAYGQNFSFSVNGTLPSLGATQSTSISLGGSVANPHEYSCSQPAGGSASVTCNANGQFSVSWSVTGNFFAMGCPSNGDGTTGACSCNNVGSGSASGSGNY